MSEREQDTPPEVEAPVRALHEAARQLLLALGRHAWTPEERGRILWAAMRGEPTTVAITLNPRIEVTIWVGAEAVAVIPCFSTAETLQ